jgi:hypothetical protein
VSPLSPSFSSSVREQLGKGYVQMGQTLPHRLEMQTQLGHLRVSAPTDTGAGATDYLVQSRSRSGVYI